VAIDGETVGTTPMATPLRLQLGRHTIEVSKPGFHPLRQVLELLGNEQTVVSGKLEPIATTGQLEVVVRGATGEQAQLLIDGKSVGHLPWVGAVEEGDHQIGAAGPTVTAEPARVLVRKNATTRTWLELRLLPGKLRVSAGDQEAIIRLDDKVVGAGTWDGEVTPGTHQLQVSRPGFVPHAQTVQVGPAETVVVDSVQLQPESASGEAADVDYSGVYIRPGLAGMLGTEATHQLARQCPPTAANGICKSRIPWGGGAELRIGYAFSGMIAAEGFVLGAVDVAATTVTFPERVLEGDADHHGMPRTEEYLFFRYGGGGGLAARTTTTHSLLRFTGSLGVGLMHRRIQYTYTGNAPPDVAYLTVHPKSYYAPIIAGDAGLMVGSSPGARFFLSLLMLLEFTPGEPTADARYPALGFRVEGASTERQEVGIPALGMAKGPQLFIGPLLGMRFGS
jgi:hypothetical protein